MRHGFALPLVLLLALAGGCDRRIEPYDPDEKVEAPDLSRIFPAGAVRAERAGGDAPPPGRGARPPGAGGAPPPGAPAAAAGPPVRGTVTVAPELTDRVPGGAVLFLIARGQQPGPPVAVKRIPAPTFPLDFELGPDDRMIAAIPFRGPLTLSARIDADQNAMTRNPGDLQGAATAPVNPGARDVSIVIDEIL